MHDNELEKLPTFERNQSWDLISAENDNDRVLSVEN